MKIGPVEVNKKLFITMVVVLGLALVATFVKSIYVNRYNKYKVNTKEDFVYTRKEFKKSDSAIPYINLNTNYAKELNQQLYDLFENYRDSDTSANSISYRYNINANIVSVVIILKSINDNDELNFDFVTYVFDLDKGAKVLSDEEIIGRYNLSESDVSKELEKQMKNKYDYEVEQEILPDTCTYDNCFLKLRGIDNYLDNANYFIENDQLVIYRSYDVYSEYSEEDIYTRDDFKFYIN